MGGRFDPRLWGLGGDGLDDLFGRPVELPANLDELVIRSGQPGALPVLIGGGTGEGMDRSLGRNPISSQTDQGFGNLLGQPIDLPPDLDDMVIIAGDPRSAPVLLSQAERQARQSGPVSPSIAGPASPSLAAGPSLDMVDSAAPTVSPIDVVGPPKEADPDINATAPTVHQQAYLVSRRIYPLPFGINIPLGRHEFVVVADPSTGEPTWEAHYGPNKAFGGQLTELSEDSSSPTPRDDRLALKEWNDPNGHWRTRATPISAPPEAVIKAGEALKQRLGDSRNPGPIPYWLLPNHKAPFANSNSAAEAIVNNAVQSVYPGSPVVGPPNQGQLPPWPWDVTPGWNHYPDRAGSFTGGLR